MNNQYLIPANSKKGQLIFNIFEPIDLGILLTGAALTVGFMFLIPGEDLPILVIKLLPISIALLLVMPIPYYHNGRVFLTELLMYLSSTKQYYWKGWCAYEFLNESKKQK